LSILRRLPLSRLLLLCGAVLIAGTSAAIATALGGGGPKPAPQPLAGAVHDALSAPPVQGVSARITFTDSLISTSSVQGSSPLISGAKGRLWASSDGRVRLELQSNKGDLQLVYDGQTISYLDSSKGTVYRFALPAHQGTAGAETGASASHGVPTVDQIQKFLTSLMTHATVSGAVPDDVAGRPAYHVKVSPSHDGGLLGGAELWWDAVHGVPLRLAVYATGRPDPVLELGVTSIHFGKVDSSVFSLPSAAKVVQVHAPASHAAAGARTRSAHRGHGARQASGARAVQAALPFSLSAPATLDRLPRSQVRMLDWGGHPAALVTYGQGLGGLAVVERQADGSAATSPAPGGQPAGHDATVTLPTVAINGARGTELVTALGTVLQFQRGGVDYIVAGSVTGPDAEAAARGL
jgi:outer membrane lipoprotein-sorting protein